MTTFPSSCVFCQENPAPRPFPAGMLGPGVSQTVPLSPAVASPVILFVMQSREKVLALGLGGVIAVWLLGPTVRDWVRGPVERRELELRGVVRELDKREDEELKTLSAAKVVGDWKKTALAGEPLEAQRALLSWVADAASASGWRSPEVTPGKPERINELAWSVPVTVNGPATAEALAELLDRVHAEGGLQGAERLTVRSESADPAAALDVTLVVEAVAMPGSKAEPADPAAAREPAEPWSSFASLSPFAKPKPADRPAPKPQTGPRNEPPRVTATTPEVVFAGGSTSARVTAVDPEGAAVSFMLLDPPAGASLRDGVLLFSPPASADDGETVVRVRATDGGDPSASADVSISFSVRADPAAMTELVGVVTVDGERVAWLIDRRDGSRKDVREGESLTMGSKTWEIKRLSRTEMELSPVETDGTDDAIEENADKKTQRSSGRKVKLGQRLAG